MNASTTLAYYHSVIPCRLIAGLSQRPKQVGGVKCPSEWYRVVNGRWGEQEDSRIRCDVKASAKVSVIITADHR